MRVLLANGKWLEAPDANPSDGDIVSIKMSGADVRVTVNGKEVPKESFFILSDRPPVICDDFERADFSLGDGSPDWPTSKFDDWTFKS